MSIWRIIDANLNRAAEGIRVLEDEARFILEDESLQKEARSLRHTLRELLAPFSDRLLSQRASLSDQGFELAKKMNNDGRTSKAQLLKANARRAEEAVRVIEEQLKLAGENSISRTLEALRPRLYQLEKDLYLKSIPEIRRDPLPEGLYGITAENLSNGRTNFDVVQQMLDAGIKIIQYREKDKDKSEMISDCRKLREMTARAGARFIVNDDPLIAREVKADGIHIGQDDYPPAWVREIVGPEMIIGLSTHSPEQARAALNEDIDYIGVGPLYSTQTKKNVCAAVGLEYLEYVAENIDIPFVAIGGIKENNLSEVVKRKAPCIALVTEITGAEDIPAQIERLNTIIQDSKQD